MKTAIQIAKIRAVVLYIMQSFTQGVDYIKLFKILYFAQQDHLVKYGKVIVEDSFRALKHGPVPAYTYKALQIAEGKPLDGNFDEFLSDIEVRDKKVYTSAVPDMDYISGANKRCLDAAIAKYKDTDPYDLSDLSHDSAWEEAWMKDGAMVLFEGQVGTIQYRKSSLYQEVAIDFVPVDEGKVNTDRAKDYFPIRKAYFELSIKEREEQKEDNGLRRELNARYDAFVAKWGCFHENDNKEFIMLDSLGVEVFTIEMQLGKDLVKSDIMREPVAFKKIDSNKRLTPIEALASSLNFYGRVDMDYLMQSTDSTKEEIIGDLKGEIFYNPAIGEWEHKGKFLSGNVITKCKEIGSYLSELTDREKDWTETAVRALVDATPEAIPYEELDINMGERWIDTKLYADFATELFKVETSVMYFDVNDTYMVRLQSYSPVAYNTYFVRNYNGEALRSPW